MKICFYKLKNSCYANSCYENSCQPRDDCTPNVDVEVFKCQCYGGDNLASNYVLFKNYINTIFHQRNNRPQPIQYWGSSKAKAKDWILKSKDNDLITQINMAFGFEHNVVVVFQSQDPHHFDINSCMRSTAMLIVVNMPVQQLNNLCLGKCREGTIANANTQGLYSIRL